MPHGPYASPNHPYETDHREIAIAVSWVAFLHCALVRRAGSWVIPCIHFVPTCEVALYPYKLRDIDKTKTTLKYTSDCPETYLLAEHRRQVEYIYRCNRSETLDDQRCSLLWICLIARLEQATTKMWQAVSHVQHSTSKISIQAHQEV